MTTAYSGDGITFPDNSVQATAPRVGMVNRIINGDMRIDQRNAGASVSIITAPFTLDRWAAQTSTGGSVQQITSTITGFANSFKYTSSASNAYLQMGQQIEYLNCYDLQNVTVSISFWAKANNSNAGSTAMVVRTRTVAGINGAARFSGPNVDTSVTITTSAVQYTVTRTLPATFGALSLEFVLGANVSGDGFEITGVQLEKGSTATDFEYVDYGRQLQMCQRYTYAPTLNAVSASTTLNGNQYFILPFPVVMRATPTYAIQSGAWGGSTPTNDGASNGNIRFASGSSFYATGSVTLLLSAEL